MTEKRFTYDSKTVSILKDGEFWLDGNIDTACNHSEICGELNALHDENEQLKQSNKGLQSELQIFKEDIKHSNIIINKLNDENEQLKKEVESKQRVINAYEQYINDLKEDGMIE